MMIPRRQEELIFMMIPHTQEEQTFIMIRRHLHQQSTLSVIHHNLTCKRDHTFLLSNLLALERWLAQHHQFPRT